MCPHVSFSNFLAIWIESVLQMFRNQGGTKEASPEKVMYSKKDSVGYTKLRKKGTFLHAFFRRIMSAFECNSVEILPGCGQHSSANIKCVDKSLLALLHQNLAQICNEYRNDET